MSVQRTPKGAALVKNTFKVKPLSPKKRQHSLQQGEKGSISTPASLSQQQTHGFLFTLASCPFLWGKKDTHLKDKEKNRSVPAAAAITGLGLCLGLPQGSELHSLLWESLLTGFHSNASLYLFSLVSLILDCFLQAVASREGLFRHRSPTEHQAVRGL